MQISFGYCRLSPYVLTLEPLHKALFALTLFSALLDFWVLDVNKEGHSVRCEMGRSGASQMPQQPWEPRTSDQLHILLKGYNEGREVSGRSELTKSLAEVWDKPSTYGTDLEGSHMSSGKCKESKSVSIEGNGMDLLCSRLEVKLSSVKIVYNIGSQSFFLCLSMSRHS